jgi:tetratricopeptide (TPR) repeat protein
MKKIILSILLTFSTLVNAQDISDCYKLANEQFEIENYEQAQNLYQRILFFDSSNTYLDSYYKLHQIERKNGNFESAISYLDRYRFYQESDTLKYFDLCLEYITLLLQSEKNKEALTEVLQLKSLNLNPVQAERLDFYLAVTYFQNKDFIQSETYFKKLIDPKYYADLAHFFKKNNRLEKKYNPVKLQIMSALLPGSGQTYSGFYKEGLNSILLVGGFVALMVKTSNVYGLLHGFISVYPWASRYHIGGVNRTRILANKRIKIKRDGYYREIISLI